MSIQDRSLFHCRRRKRLIMISLLLRRSATAFLVPQSPRFRIHSLARRGRQNYYSPLTFSSTRLSSSAAALQSEKDFSDRPIVDSNAFEVTAKFDPTGDQPQAIEQLLTQLRQGDRFSILRGITGTGKTLVMSHVIAGLGKPTLVLCHNKTLAAQLARELRSFLSNNAVELFVSYYNHYVPESFVETTGKYIAKKSSVNSDIDALRHRATRALMTRRDVVVVASVSCIYGLGLPKEYLDASLEVEVGELVHWDDFLGKLDGMLYDCNTNDDEFDRGHYQISQVGVANGREIRTVTLWLPHEKFPMQIELGQQQEQNLYRIHAIREGTQEGLMPIPYTRIFPAKHHVTSEERLEEACIAIEEELRGRLSELVSEDKHIEANRLQQRVINDLMMLRETGFCSGGENYSRHFAGREAGEPPDTLMDYLCLHGDWLLMVDESHVTLPQLKAMYGGDQARKRLLVKHGYRLPSALDNRPLQEQEFWQGVDQTLFVSATPSKKELALAEREPVEMLIRPTFVCDPEIEIRTPKGQLEDLLKEIQTRAEKQQRTLVVTLTKRDAEDLSAFLNEHGANSTYIHSGLSTSERSDALRALQSGEVDCLVGINCLREGLDLPQVSLVAVLNADSEGFLRSETALLQIVGRAARNIHGKAIFYANRITDSMKKCMEDTGRRRERQLAYNDEFDCEMRSTNGSSMLSIFDLLKDQIESELPLEVVGRKKKALPGNPDGSITIPSICIPSNGKTVPAEIVTDHIPNSPGVYFWRDTDDNILYIGKAVKLRSRVKSYLSPKAKHSPRIKAMVKKASSVDFVLTPSDRDALVLESNLIKHHQPPFNVLLKDDEHYPYICASVGDRLPRFSIVPRRQEGIAANQNYRYFGPYTSFKEINAILEGIEEKYDLRSQAFLARHGSGSREEYCELFEKALQEVFGDGGVASQEQLHKLRSEYEEANMLFDSKFNRCRDVVTIAQVEDQDTSAVVHVLQLRQGLVAGRFSYTCEVPCGLRDEEDAAAAIQTVLQRRHYPSGEEARDSRFSWFPDELLLSHTPTDAKELRSAIREARSLVEPERKKTIAITTASIKGPRKAVDARALEFAMENAQQVAYERSLGQGKRAALTSSVDGTAARELANLLSLDKEPSRIECYDVSHTQGDFPVASRVVFVNGRPEPSLYRKFNIQTVQGVDDYASLEEVLERRFRRAWINGRGGPVDEKDPWAIPDLVLIDGGPGQLHAAIKGMSKASILPVNNVPQEQSVNRSAHVAICALAKNQEQVFVHGKKEPVNDVPDSPALLLLRSLRDESHRFALSAHRKRRSVSKVA